MPNRPEEGYSKENVDGTSPMRVSPGVIASSPGVVPGGANTISGIPDAPNPTPGTSLDAAQASAPVPVYVLELILEELRIQTALLEAMRKGETNSSVALRASP